MRRKSVTAFSILSMLGAFTVASAAAPDTRGPIVWGSVVLEEIDSVVAVESEHFYKQTLNEVRSWHLFTRDQQPKVDPDAEPLAGPVTGRFSRQRGRHRRSDRAHGYLAREKVSCSFTHMPVNAVPQTLLQAVSESSRQTEDLTMVPRLAME